MVVVLLALVAMVGMAQPGNLHLIRATPQQLIVGYTAPAGDPCSIEASKDPDFSTRVNDINAGLFANSNLDRSRESTYEHGESRAIVLGARAIELAQNGKRYSRSLQPGTAYYVRISGCGGSASIPVSTAAPAWGPTLEPYPFLPDQTGLYGYESTDFSSAARNSRVYIDHATGAEIRPLTLPSDTVSEKGLQSASFAPPIALNWTNPGNAITPDSLVASTTTRDVLFFPQLSGTDSDAKVVPYENYQAYRLRMYLRARITGSAAGNAAKLNVCLGNATDCLTPVKQLDLSTCSISAEQGDCAGFGNQQPLDDYWGEFGVPCYTIPDSGTNAQICATSWNASTIGLRVWKESSDPSQVLEIDSARYDLLRFHMAGTTTSGPMHCGYSTVQETGDKRKWQLCYVVNQLATGRSWIYAIEIDTGEAHYIGPTIANGAKADIFWDAINPLMFYTLNRVGTTTSEVYRCTFAAVPGTFSSDWTGGNAASNRYSCVNLTPPPYDLTRQTADFHPLFTNYWKTRGFNWRAAITTGGNKLLIFSSVPQDTGQWMAVFDPSAAPPAGCPGCIGGIVAARPYGAAATPQIQKYCVNHSETSVFSPTSTFVALLPGRVSTTNGTSPWAGPWRITLRSTSDPNVFQQLPDPLTGSYKAEDPTPSGSGEGDTLPLEVGDMFIWKGGGVTALDPNATLDEQLEIAAIDNVNHLITVLRGSNIENSPWFPKGAFAPYNGNRTLNGTITVYGYCRSMSMTNTAKGELLWDWKTDPYGNQVTLPGSTGPNQIWRINHGSHASRFSEKQIVARNHADCGWLGASCFAIQEGSTPATIHKVPNKQVIYSASWAGRKPSAPSVNSHPTHSQFSATGVLREYLSDIMPFDAGTGTIALVNGQAYTYKVSGYTLQRKHFATISFASGRILRDISAPNSLIDDTKPGTYCVALIAGECRPGSSAGDVYAAVAPGWPAPVGCGSGGDEAPKTCIADAVPYAYAPMQLSTQRSEYAGSTGRTLAMFQVRPLTFGKFQVAIPLLNGKWVLYFAADQMAPQWYLLKTERIPEVSSRNTLTFERVQVDLPAPANATSMRIEFGYAEYGGPKQYRCASRAEACSVDASSFDISNPFKWASESKAAIPCTAARCRAEIPRIPGRVVFSRASFRDGAGSVIETRTLPPL